MQDNTSYVTVYLYCPEILYSEKYSELSDINSFQNPKKGLFLCRDCAKTDLKNLENSGQN
jgi:hypothetical protein